MESIKFFQLGKFKSKKIKNKIYDCFKRENLNLKTLSGLEKNLKIPDLRNDLNLCCWLETQFKPYIFKSFPKKYHENLSLQFPMSIRLFMRYPNKASFHKYSTLQLHTDIWSGAPKKIRNFLYYVKVSKNSSFCKMFESIRGIKKYENYRGDYKNAPVKEKNLNEIKYKKTSGVLISFDSFSPHYTLFPRNCDDIRISLDFRVKIGSPYYENKKIIPKKKFLNKPGVIGDPGTGFYWTLIKKKLTLKDKIKEELEISKKKSRQAYELRKAYINQNKILSTFL